MSDRLPTITRQDMKRLRRRLPRGFGKLALERLSAAGKPCTQQYISLQFTQPRDLQVIEVLAVIAEEYERGVVSLASRIRRAQAA